MHVLTTSVKRWAARTIIGSGGGWLVPHWFFRGDETNLSLKWWWCVTHEGRSLWRIYADHTRDDGCVSIGLVVAVVCASCCFAGPASGFGIGVPFLLRMFPGAIRFTDE